LEGKNRQLPNKSAARDSTQAAANASKRMSPDIKRAVIVAAFGLSLASCSSMPSWMQFDRPKPAPVATTMQLESEPAGAEAKTSVGQACRTPCSVAVSATEFTVTFSLPGYQPQTVPIQAVAAAASQTSPFAEPPAPRLVPNPVFVHLQPVAPPPAARRKPVPKRNKPKPASRPAPAAAAQPAAPAPAPASPWPPPPTR
jgi:hypothetical protein